MMIRLFALLFTLPVTAAPMHGIAVHDELKYKPGDTHFAYADPKAKKGGTLQLGEVAKVDSLNPWILKGDSTPVLQKFTYASLMKRAKDEPFALYGYVAESVEMPEDRSFIVFHLRKEARFEDGSPLTADDVIFTFNIIKEKGNPRFKMNYGAARKIQKISDHAVKIIFDPQKSDKESPLILAMMPVLSKAQYEKLTFEETTLVKPLSAGPYRVKSFDPGKKLELERVKNFWGENIFVQKGMNNFDNIVVTYFRDENVRLENFLNGGLDFFQETDFARWKKSYNTPAVEEGKLVKLAKKNGRPFGMFGIALNTRRDFFKDKQVREALILLMNQDQINKNYYYGFYEPVTSFFNNSELSAQGDATEIEKKIIDECKGYTFPSCFSANEHNTSSPRIRLRKALDMLKKAGWALEGKNLKKDGKIFEFELLIAEKPHEKIALAYADMLKKAGIKLNVRFVDSAQYTARKDNFDFDSVIHLWGVSASPGIEQNLYWSSKAADTKGSRNYPGIKDSRVDELIQKMLQQKTRTEYLHYIKALDRVLWSQRAVVPLVYWNKDLLAYWNKFEQPVYDEETAKTLNYLFQPCKVIETWWMK